MVQAMKDAQEFLQACPWAGFVGEPLGDLATATNDLLKLDYAQKFSSTFSHISGTAAMSPVGAAHGVVDPNLLVKRVSGLSIVDASVFVRIYKRFGWRITEIFAKKKTAYHPILSHTSCRLHYRRACCGID